MALLANGEARGLPGAAIQTIAFQQRASGCPLDDVLVNAVNGDGSPATLEIQAKRTLRFTASDDEFKDVVTQIWQAAQKPAFMTTRYELATAIARTTTRIEQSCQEVLHWARQLPDGATFATHIARKGFASDGMRNFVDVFRANLAAIHAPTDDDTVWCLLRRFQILVFDFESPGSDYEHRARERARFALAPAQAARATALWPVLLDHVGACARAGGARDRPETIRVLRDEHGFEFEPRADLRSVDVRLAEAADDALAEIKDTVGGVRLARTHLIEEAQTALEQRRVLHIVGKGGVGKSFIMKALVQRAGQEGRAIVLRNGRIVPGGWMQMAHTIGCSISRDELFNELGCGGGATLFIDNVDQIARPAEWATVADLLSGVAKCPGWRAVVTGGIGSNEWKLDLPAAIGVDDIAQLTVDPISDEETEVLSQGNPSLAMILGGDHPAHGVARNLFYLSRMIELGVDTGEGASGIASETDLARLWWRYGGGRAEDDGRFARLKVLRTIGVEALSTPSRVTFDVDVLDSSTVASLVRFDSLREDTKGATVAFRHDVLRDWTIGFLIHEKSEALSALPMGQPLAPSLARGIEVAARLALDADITGERWSTLLAAAEKDGAHGSWMRPVLLALPRSEKAPEHFAKVNQILLADEGRRLGAMIRLMMAVESEPLANVVARLEPPIPVLAGANDLILPRGAGWMWLVLWLLAIKASLPTARIPDAAKVFQAWLIATQQQNYSCNAAIVDLLFEWLALIEDNMSCRMVRRMEDAPPSLNIPHLRDVRDEVRMTAFAFARLNPAAADHYLTRLDPNEVRHQEMQSILTAYGSLPQAAPAALANFALGALIEKEDPDDLYRRDPFRYGPFSVYEHFFLPASPGQGPFFQILEHSPSDGLRLVRGLVEHATHWRRTLYARDRRAFPRISIPFPNCTKSFDGDASVYSWSRTAVPSVITTSALMALEAWGHKQTESGRPFEEVLDDVLGPDGSSIAFLAVAADLVLSHWKVARDVAWPLVATPELLVLDDARSVRDTAGVDHLTSFEKESNSWPVKRADIDAKPSRRARLSFTIGDYALQATPALLTALRDSLEQARNEILQKPAEEEDPINGLRATAERAVHMTFAENWPLTKITLSDGREFEVHQYQRAPEDAENFAAGAARADANMRDMNIRLKVQAAFLDASKSTTELLVESVAWANEQTGTAEPMPDDDEQDNFSKSWDRRAVVMTAALAARDYEESDRSQVVDWALPILNAASQEQGEYDGNDQIAYNIAAIAALGLLALYRRDGDEATRDALLRLASCQQLAVIKAIGDDLPGLAKRDARLPRSLIRIIMTSSVYPRRAESELKSEALNRANRDRIEDAINGERAWLVEGEAEPAWPELPPWQSRRRRAIRIGTLSTDEDEEDDSNASYPDHYVDEHLLGALTGHLIRLTLGDLPPWITALAAHFMRWTDEANGPHDLHAREQENRPHNWNAHFFDFAGILSVALPHREVVELFLDPMVRFKDEPFYDAMAAYLRGYDRAALAIDTKNPENPAAVRSIFADRIEQGRNYRRYQREKTFMSETHAGDAMTAMYFQPYRLASAGRPIVPDNWDGLGEAMPILTKLVEGAPSSGYLAILFLNLVETSPRAAFIPFLARVMTAWCSAYGMDPNFWSEKEIGVRACAWFTRALEDDPASTPLNSEIADGIMRSLDVLVRSGVAQARQVEQRIAGSSP